MAFASIRPALKYIALLRTYNGSGSAGSGGIYEPPIMIKCYPSVENKLMTNSAGATIVSKTILYVSADVPVKEQDIVIIECASPNWMGKNFESEADRDEYYTCQPQRLIANKTWCCVCKKPQYYDGADWNTSFDGIKIDGEIRGKFQGKTDKILSVSKYFDGFGWEDDAEYDDGLSIQEIGL